VGHAVVLRLFAAIVVMVATGAVVALLGSDTTGWGSAPKPAVYTVPKNIKSDCSIAVEDRIMTWLATVPDGSTVRFGKGRCYGQDGTITSITATGNTVN
jgi:hypothetical protein